MHARNIKEMGAWPLSTRNCKGHQAAGPWFFSWTLCQSPGGSFLRVGMVSSLIPAVSSASTEQPQNRRACERETTTPTPPAEALKEELGNHCPGVCSRILALGFGVVLEMKSDPHALESLKELIPRGKPPSLIRVTEHDRHASVILVVQTGVLESVLGRSRENGDALGVRQVPAVGPPAAISVNVRARSASSNTEEGSCIR